MLVLVVLAATKWLIPWLLYQITATRNRELFLLSVFSICFGVAFLAVGLGLSLALGAFFAGLIISESEYSTQALGNMIPFRDAFVSFFFISIGMLLDVSFALSNLPIILVLVLGIMLGKALVTTFVTLALSAPLKAAIVAGLTLSQVGEFSFVLSKVGMSAGLLDQNTYQYFLAVSILTMALTPLVIGVAPKIASWISNRSVLSALNMRHPEAALAPESKRDHLIVVGYGENGRNLADAAKTFNLPYVIVEMNPDTVMVQRRKGEPIFYGDASFPSVLESAGLKQARLLAIGIPDSATTRRIVQLAKMLNPRVHVIARTQLVKETGPLFELGADDVVPLEYETAIEIASRTLNQFLIPRNDIDEYVRRIRADRYEMFRKPERNAAPICDWQRALPGLTIYTFRVEQNAPVANRTLAGLGLRNRLDTTILAIHRNEKVLANPSADTMVLPEDVLVVMTHGNQFEQIEAEFRNPVHS
jgi:CPA2 family monovalent cation:H+ antiporter-2